VRPQRAISEPYRGFHIQPGSAADDWPVLFRSVNKSSLRCIAQWFWRNAAGEVKKGVLVMLVLLEQELSLRLIPTQCKLSHHFKTCDV
jgi:hypothetical protein